MSNTGLNLKNKARNPGSIANDEHNDAAGANRSANGDIIAIERIIPSAEHTAAAGADVPERATLRLANTTAAWQFVFIGDQDVVPVTLDITTSIAIAPNSSSLIFTGISSSDMKSLKLRTSSASVQVVVMQP
jgi:hypothetical protein